MTIDLQDPLIAALCGQFEIPTHARTYQVVLPSELTFVVSAFNSDDALAQGLRVAATLHALGRGPAWLDLPKLAAAQHDVRLARFLASAMPLPNAVPAAVTLLP
jgi:hypothetical protein